MKINVQKYNNQVKFKSSESRLEKRVEFVNMVFYLENENHCHLQNVEDSI